ncbi:AAA family ATPase [Desmonostoc muscorum LEGE 12446]|uniref:AAA family ATPase n=1 Tax=Desmonostoc muscorum LEGE 12446 TaxID=1828758 RepID=A0A8J6ZKZ9_DESMC|nr:AAA family ATPase [Desmonostoc muscorum]MCF2151108.1 AAA family ATPase [Desmonostoc muscorum LEGE 12446]
MKVKRLKMESFRGIGDLTLEFDEMSPTVLIGINGVGKSSILDCIAILLSHLIARSQFDYTAERYFQEDDIKNKYKKTRNEITILLLYRQLTWSLTALRQQETTEINNDLTELIAAIEDDDIYKQLEGGENTNIPLAVYYPVNRAVFDIRLKIKENVNQLYLDPYKKALTGISIDFGYLFQWFREREDLENEERRDNPAHRDKQLEAVRQAIYLLIPDFYNLRVRRSPLRMTVRKQGEELIVNQLSDGEKCLLAMVGDLARRLAIANPSLPDPLQGSGVVLIDEIELHLHPKWQREIIPALTRTFPNCQFIVSTHSPQVISQVKPEGIYILEKTDEGVIAKKPESSFGRDSNRILEDLMGVPARPQEIKDRLHELFRLIDEGNLDGARQLSQEIADIIGQDEPELVKASVSIRRKEILKR